MGNYKGYEVGNDEETEGKKDGIDSIKGGRVEMFDGSHQGTIIEVQGPHCLLIAWDDGKTGHVHPLDVTHLEGINANH